MTGRKAEKGGGKAGKLSHLQRSGRLEVPAAHECGQLWKTELEPVVLLVVTGDRNLFWGKLMWPRFGPLVSVMCPPLLARFCCIFVALSHPIEPADTTLIHSVAHSFES